MEFKHHVVHVVSFEHCRQGATSQFLVEITTHDHLISFCQPGFEVSFEIFEESHIRASGVVIVIEKLDVLLPDTFVTIFAVTRTVDTHTAQNNTILTLEACPAPTAQASRIFTNTVGMTTDITKRQHCCATPLGFFTHTFLSIVSCASFALPELEILSEYGQQLLISGQAVPVDAAFLQHVNGDLVVFQHVAQVIIFQVLGVERESVHVEDESSKV